jgi:hypothetical protein
MLAWCGKIKGTAVQGYGNPAQSADISRCQKLMKPYARGMESGSPPERAMVRVVATSAVGDETDEIAYWMTVPVADRIAAVEVLRRRVFGYDDVTRPELQRVCRIIRHS